MKYQTAGVRKFWLIYPEKNHTTVYNIEHEAVEEYAFGEEIPVGIYEDFRIKVE